MTEQLGDVMKESAQIALSYLRSHGGLGLPVGDLAERNASTFRPVRSRRTGRRRVSP